MNDARLENHLSAKNIEDVGERLRTVLAGYPRDKAAQFIWGHSFRGCGPTRSNAKNKL